MKPKEDSAATTRQFKVNLPTGLHREVKVRAAINVRSINGEVIYLLQKGIAAEQLPQGAQQ